MSADYRMPRQRPRFTRPIVLSAGVADGRARSAHDGPSGRSTHGAASRYSARLWRTEGCTLIVYSRQENVRKISTVKYKALIDSGRSTRCAPFRSRFLFSEMPIKQLERSRPRTSRRRDLSVGGRFGGRSRRSNVRRKARANGWGWPNPVPWRISVIAAHIAPARLRGGPLTLRLVTASCLR
jgi:hypothetical protein